MISWAGPETLRKPLFFQMIAGGVLENWNDESKLRLSFEIKHGRGRGFLSVSGSVGSHGILNCGELHKKCTCKQKILELG